MKTIPIRTFTPEILSLWNAQKARPHCIGIVVRRQFHLEIFSKAQNVKSSLRDYLESPKRGV